MEKEPYLLPRQPLREQFATDKMFQVAKEFYERYLTPLAEEINKDPCSHRKHEFRLSEDLLRAKPNEKLIIDFNTDRMDKAILQEWELKTSTDQNAVFSQRCNDIKKFFRKEIAALVKREKFEKTVFTSMIELTQLFHETIATPEEFHRDKAEWLERFNQQNAPEPATATS